MNCLLSPSFCCSSGQFICVYDCQEYVFLALLCPMFAIRICLLVSVKCGFFQPFPFHLYHLLEQSLPFYDLLKRESKKIPSSMKPSLPLPSLPVAANEKLLAWVGNELLPRDSAKVNIMWFWEFLLCGMGFSSLYCQFLSSSPIYCLFPCSIEGFSFWLCCPRRGCSLGGPSCVWREDI